MNLKGRNFLTLKDFTPEEITYMIDLAAELKAKKKAGELHEYYKGKNIALIFEKTSTRTRCAFEVAAHDLGMGSTYLDPTGSGACFLKDQGNVFAFIIFMKLSCFFLCF